MIPDERREFRHTGESLNEQRLAWACYLRTTSFDIWMECFRNGWLVLFNAGNIQEYDTECHGRYI